MKNLSKKQKILSLILFIILISLFIIVGSRDYPKSNSTKIFDDSSDNSNNVCIFKCSNSLTTYSAINSGNAIILFGFENNEFIKEYSNIIKNVMDETDVHEILYYDFLEDRNNNNATYESIVNYLIDYLKKDDEGNVDLVSPSLLIIKDYNIIYYDEISNIPANVTSEMYWNEYEIGLKKSELSYVFNIYKEEK